MQSLNTCKGVHEPCRLDAAPHISTHAAAGPVGRAGTRAAPAAAAAAASNAAAYGAGSQAADGAGHPSGANGRSASSSSGQPFMGAEYFPKGEFSIDFQVRLEISTYGDKKTKRI